MCTHCFLRFAIGGVSKTFSLLIMKAYRKVHKILSRSNKTLIGETYKCFGWCG